MSDEHTLTILRAAQAILRDEGIERVNAAHDYPERVCANEALRASCAIDRYLQMVNDLERPF